MKNSELIEVILKQVKQPLWENWYIQERIGSGAYSAVYKVTANRMSRTDISALKIEPIVPDPSAKLDEAGRKRYIEEHRALAVNESTIMYSLKNCPNIVSYEDEDIRQLIINGKLEGYYFLIRMEYLDCLSDLLKNRQYKLEEKNVLRLACDIGRGIKAAHDLGIIHRDLKPGNFFIDKNGVYKLGDFNISKQTDFSKDIAGTRGYLAPEVFYARSGSGYDRQADIYSFGICLYQLMNDLYLPFEDRMPAKDAVAKRMNGDALPPPKRASGEFTRIILKACAYRKEERYATIDDLLRDLDALERGVLSAPVTAQQSPFIQPVKESAPDPAPLIPPDNPPFPQSKGFDPLPVIAGIVAVIVIGVSIFLCIRLLKNGSKSQDKNDSSASAARTTAAQTEDDSQPGEMRIILEKDTVDINVYEDITIKNVDCPEKIKADEITEMFGYDYDVELFASAVVSFKVESDGQEDVFVDCPKGLDIKTTPTGTGYEMRIDATASSSSEKDYVIVIRNSDSSAAKTLTVSVKRTGPFRNEVRRVSSDPDVIEFHDDGTFTVHSTGTATISWIYNDEIKFQKTVTIEE